MQENTQGLCLSCTALKIRLTRASQHTAASSDIQPAVFEILAGREAPKYRHFPWPVLSITSSTTLFDKGEIRRFIFNKALLQQGGSGVLQIIQRETAKWTTFIERNFEAIDAEDGRHTLDGAKEIRKILLALECEEYRLLQSEANAGVSETAKLDIYDAKWQMIKRGYGVEGQKIQGLGYVEIPWPVLEFDPSKQVDSMLTRDAIKEFLEAWCKRHSYSALECPSKGKREGGIRF